MINAGLVLEGGGMRGVYTAGVLDFFIEKDLWFKECFAVSAGAGNACSYLARQKGRGYAVNTDYLRDKRYCSLYSLLKTGDLFGADMIYNVIPHQLYPIDYGAFNQNESTLYAVVTNCVTGLAQYIPIKDLRKDLIYIRASASLPMVSRMVEINGQRYLDGGVTDSVPLQKSIENGNRFNIVILTRDQTYRKKQTRGIAFIKAKYRCFPQLTEQIQRRYLHYNQALDLIDREEKQCRAFVIRPKRPVSIGKMEKNSDKLKMLYEDGYRDAQSAYENLSTFLKQTREQTV